MKLTGFLPVMLALTAFAQSSTLHGTRIGQVQTVYLSDVPPPAEFPFGGPARLGDLPSATPATGAAAAAVKAEFETWVEQRSRDYAESVLPGFASIEREATKATVHRFVRDNFHNISVTYTMTFETIPGSRTFRVAFSDSSVPTPAPQILRDGETITLTLSAGGQTERRMVDYIRVGTGNMKPRQDVTRDVYAENAELTLTEPRLRINGVEQPASSLSAKVSGPVVWVYIPAQGRYALSFKPREGFELAGEVAENALTFSSMSSSGGNVFRIDCADRIAAGSGTYNIYARKEPAAGIADPARFAAGVAK